MVNIYLEERYVKSYSESLISEYNGDLSICTVIANWKDLSIILKKRESGVLQPRYCKVQSIWFDTCMYRKCGNKCTDKQKVD